MRDRVLFVERSGERLYAARLRLKVWSRSESEFEKGVKLHIMGPKPGDLPMVRLKWK